MLRSMLIAAGLVAVAPALAGETIDYDVGGEAYSGYLAMPPAGEPRGLVLIIHDWDGPGDYERRRADMLAELGYAAFVADLYGSGNRPETLDAKRAASSALYADREAMRRRILAGLATARAQVDLPAVVMGYCFGGTAALELARTRTADDVLAYTSFHGGLATPEGQSWDGVEDFVLILHGGADRAVPLDELMAVTAELEAADTPYEVQIYSGAPHAFTVFGSERYRERADREAWEAFTDLLADRFDG